MGKVKFKNEVQEEVCGGRMTRSKEQEKKGRNVQKVL